jgi:hypothetical protein
VISISGRKILTRVGNSVFVRCVQEKGRVEDQVGEAHRELGRERQSRREQEEERRTERDLWERDQIHANHMLQELSREVYCVSSLAGLF